MCVGRLGWVSLSCGQLAVEAAAYLCDGGDASAMLGQARIPAAGDLD